MRFTIPPLDSARAARPVRRRRRRPGLPVALLALSWLVAASCTVRVERGERAPAPAAATEVGLEAELRSLLDGFGGHVGVYARRLEAGTEVAIAADEIYPTASMVKVPLLIGLYEAESEGRLDLDARLTYADSLYYASDEDLLNKLSAGSEVSLWQLAVQMIVLSDNTASL